MIVNSSQGGGSKDTWVLEGDDATARPRRQRAEVAAAAARPAPGGLAPAAATAAAADARPDRPRAVLARPPPRARRAHRAHARRPLPRRPPGPPRRSRLGHALVGRAAGDHGRRPASAPPGPRRRRAAAHDRDREPGLDRVLRLAAREGARTLRDVFSAEMWEAVNTFQLGLLGRQDLDAGLRTGPYSIYSLREGALRCSGASPTRTMLKDDARAFLVAGGRDRGGRHGAADAARGAAARPERRRRGPRGAAPRRQRARAAAAVGGFQAFMRAAAAPPNAGPCRWFLLYEREFPDSVAASVESLPAALDRVEAEPHDSPPVLRVRRMLADLDFRARVSPGPDAVSPQLASGPAGARAARRRDRDRFFASQHRRRQTVTG